MSTQTRTIDRPKSCNRCGALAQPNSDLCPDCGESSSKSAEGKVSIVMQTHRNRLLFTRRS